MKKAKLLGMAAALGLAACALPMAASAANCAPLTGGYVPSRQQALTKLTTCSFTAPGVTIDRKTNTVNGVVDADGHAISVTLSTDGHFYIIPTTDGYLYVGTGF